MAERTRRTFRWRATRGSLAVARRAAAAKQAGCTCGIAEPRRIEFWGAHAPRVRVLAPSPETIFHADLADFEKFAIARARSPAREARALPRVCRARNPRNLPVSFSAMNSGNSTRSTKWLNRFAWLTCVATLLLICSGGMVTSKNVGLAVPDWPTTFGYNMFLFPISRWVGGILFEHTHRLMGSLVGFLTVTLAVWLWLREDRRWVRRLGVIALVGVILQGILGGLRVTMMKDQIGIFHACVAQAFLGLLVVIALATTNFWRSVTERLGDSQKFSPIKKLAVAITIAIYAQLALGATMRHQHRDLAILDFPTANGAWIPDTSAAALAKINACRDARALSDVSAFQIWLQMVHRFLAAIIAIAIVAFCARVWGELRDFVAIKRLSLLWVVLIFGQIALGAEVIWCNK